jgi:hypothetical protein
LGLRNLPDGENITIAEWLLAATRAWKGEWTVLFLFKAAQ